jgi:hypothetical protein
MTKTTTAIHTCTRYELPYRAKQAFVQYASDNKLHIRADLTFRQRIDNEETTITEDIAKKNIADFMKQLNRAVYKTAHKRFNKRLNVISIIEGGDIRRRYTPNNFDKDKRIHAHILLERPSFISDYNYIKMIEKFWRQTRWAYDVHKIEPIRTLIGSAKYNVKAGLDNVDMRNTYLTSEVSHGADLDLQ